MAKYGHGKKNWAFWSGAGAMEVVDARLQLVAQAQELAIARPELADQHRKARPEFGGRQAGARQRFTGDEVMEHTGDLQSGDFDSMVHDTLVLFHADSWHGTHSSLSKEGASRRRSPVVPRRCKACSLITTVTNVRSVRHGRISCTGMIWIYSLIAIRATL